MPPQVRSTGKAAPRRLTSHQRQIVARLLAAHGDDVQAMVGLWAVGKVGAVRAGWEPAYCRVHERVNVPTPCYTALLPPAVCKPVHLVVLPCVATPSCLPARCLRRVAT